MSKRPIHKRVAVRGVRNADGQWRAAWITAMLVFSALWILAAGQIAFAQEFPNKPVKLVAPVSAGGGGDAVARIVAEKLSAIFGQQVIVDNRPGASNIIGTEIVAKAPPDGYTILAVNNVHAINAGLFQKLPYDPERDFTPISLIGSTPYILVVHPSLPVRSVQDLIRLAKANPGQINYASAGNGTSAHFAAELFKMMAKADMTHISYKGVTPAVIDVIAGSVQVMFPSPASAYSHVKTGRLRLIAVTTATRPTTLPDVPTIQESGVPGYEFSNWYALLAPRGTPSNVIMRFSQGIKQIMQLKDVHTRLAGEGIEPVGSAPEYFRDYMRAEIKKYAMLVKAIGLKAD